MYHDANIWIHLAISVQVIAWQKELTPQGTFLMYVFHVPYLRNHSTYSALKKANLLNWEQGTFLIWYVFHVPCTVPEILHYSEMVGKTLYISPVFLSPVILSFCLPVYRIQNTEYRIQYRNTEYRIEKLST